MDGAKIFGVLLGLIVAAVLAVGAYAMIAVAVCFLWNEVAHAAFGAPSLTFAQAFGGLVLIAILRSFVTRSAS